MHRVLGTEPSSERTSGAHQKVAPDALHHSSDEASFERRPAVDRSFHKRHAPQVRPATRLAPLRVGLALALADQLAAWCCFVLAAAAAWLFGFSLEVGATVPVAVCVALIIGYAASGLYPAVGVNPVVETRQIVVTSTVVFAVVVLSIWAIGPAAGVTPVLASAWLFSVVVLPVGRMVGRALFCRYSWWTRPVAIDGDREIAQQVAARLRRWRTLGLEPIGNLDQFPRMPSPSDDLQRLRTDRPIDGETCAHPPGQAVEFPHFLIVDATSTYPSLWSKALDIDGYAVRHGRHLLGSPSSSGWRHVKRAFDVVAAGLLALLLMPVFMVIAGFIRISSRGPVLYSQERVGCGGRPFRAWKFRTMVLDADRVLADYLKGHPELREEWARNHKLKSDPRVIPGVGRLLRYYSLDELPQLWNVVCGEMSVVGPRPIVQEEISKYQDEFATYTQVKPGITGLWQISGRNNTTYARRVFLDSYYIRNWSPWLDYYILLRTVKTVVLREGAY